MDDPLISQLAGVLSVLLITICLPLPKRLRCPKPKPTTGIRNSKMSWAWDAYLRGVLVAATGIGAVAFLVREYFSIYDMMVERMNPTWLNTNTHKRGLRDILCGEGKLEGPAWEQDQQLQCLSLEEWIKEMEQARM
jgi:hypothetical protein